MVRKWIRLIRYGGCDGVLFFEVMVMFIDIVWNVIKMFKDVCVCYEVWNLLSEYDLEFIIENDSSISVEIAASALFESFGEELFVGVM